MRKLLFSLALLVGFASQAMAADNYAATAGSGLTFGAKDAAGVLYSRFIGCDNTTVSRCWVVGASGDLLVTVNNTLTAVTPGDGITTTIYGTAPASPVIGVPLLWNGTTYDRWKSVATGVASVGAASGSFASGSIAAGAQVDLLTMRGTKAAGTAAANSLLAGGVYNSTVVAPTDGQQVALQVTASGALRTRMSNEYPDTAVPYTATATGTTGATTATLAGAASVTTYICGFSIRANATAAVTGNATVTGVITATLNFTQWTAPNASGLGITEMIFSPCIPASGTNQSVAVVSAAPGTGGVVSVTAWGYKL